MSELSRSFRGPHPTPKSAKKHVERARRLALSGKIQEGFEALARIAERAIHFHEVAAASALDESVRKWEDAAPLRSVYAKAFLIGESSKRGNKLRLLRTES